MEWLNKQVSLYSSHTDNAGRPVTLRSILFTQFAMPHKPKYQHKEVNDLDTIIQLRNLDPSAEDYKAKKLKLKSSLQCYTPAGLLKSKQKGNVIELKRSGVMQLDFDYNDIKDYDIEELKRCLFDLPFIGFCGRSCGGNGFYALALIAEPDRLSEYAEHAFEVLLDYGIKADTSKGKKVE